MKNNITNDINDNKILNVRSIEINDLPTNNDHACNKKYVDDEVLTKTDSTILKNNQHNDMNNYTITNVNNIQINNTPTQNDQVTNKKYMDDKIDNTSVVRLNDDSNNIYLQVRVLNTAYNLQLFSKAQIIDTTVIQSPNTGGYALQNWLIKCSDKNGSGKITNFIKTTKTNSPTGDAGATTLPPISNSFLYIEPSGNNEGLNVYCSFERTDLIHISNITFYYNITHTGLHKMGRFRIQFLRTGAWEDFYTMEKNTNFSELSTDWTLLILDVTKDNYGIKLYYDQIETEHGDMCFSNIMITHSIF